MDMGLLIARVRRRQSRHGAGCCSDNAHSQTAQEPRGSAGASLSSVAQDEIILKEARTMVRLAADHGDDGTNDLIVSEIIRNNELQVWFMAEHVVDVPPAHAV